MEDSTWIPLPDACVRLSLAHPVVYRLVLTGRLRSRREGKLWMILREDVEKFARERTAALAVATSSAVV